MNSNALLLFMATLLILAVVTVARVEQQRGDLVRVRDSVALVISERDRDTAQAHAWRRRQAALLVGAESTMLRYARIVARDPSQAVFLVGWTRRAFDNAVARQ